MVSNNIERIEDQLAYFESAVARLNEALLRDEDEFMRDSIIQRFEFTFEMAWKSMFRYLSDKGEKLAPKAWDVLPVAFESHLINNAEVWQQMRDYRNDTSHEYNRVKAVEVSAFVRGHGAAALEQAALELRRRVTAGR